MKRIEQHCPTCAQEVEEQYLISGRGDQPFTFNFGISDDLKSFVPLKAENVNVQKIYLKRARELEREEIMDAIRRKKFLSISQDHADGVADVLNTVEAIIRQRGEV